MPAGRPIVVTGMARCGTSWVGKMIEASGQAVYLNEPLNPRHPPGRCPGVFRAQVEHEYQYLAEYDASAYEAAFQDTFSLRYHPVAELRQNRRPFDLLKMGRDLLAFYSGRQRGRRPLLDDPYAVFAAAWLTRRFDAQTVVIVRHPAAMVASYRRLGWSVDLRELYDQPSLIKDFLDPFRGELVAALDVGRGDHLMSVSLLWKLIYHVVASCEFALNDFHVICYESLAADPLGRFAYLYDLLGLRFTEQVAAHVAAGSSGGSSARSHAWRLSGPSLLSRTAYRPMDSRANATSWTHQLDDDELQRIRDITRAVADRYYGASWWDGGLAVAG